MHGRLLEEGLWHGSADELKQTGSPGKEMLSWGCFIHAAKPLTRMRSWGQP